MQELDHYAVMGNPIEHSLSPLIHQQFAHQTKQGISYQKILVPKGEFKKAVQEFQNQGGCGLNITLPFKNEAYLIANKLSERAKIAKAVNTILFKDKRIIGDNTDGIGLVRDIQQNHNITIQAKSILILGAGGATSGILGPLLDEKPQSILIANRTKSKAEELVQQFQLLNDHIYAQGLNELGKQAFDIIINATSSSLTNEEINLPDNIVTKESYCYDLMYGAHTTPFLQWANHHGAKYCVDGLGMLVEQAAESFFLWRDVRPETKSVIRYISEYLMTKTS